MKRKIIEIDSQKCNGCGLCASACHEGAIAIVDGKATLLRDDYCDGMGDCLPACPTGAITFTERDAPEYNGYGAPKARNWPIQLKLTATQSPEFRGTLTVAADCVGFRSALEFGSPLLIGCPKLDGVDYSDKLAEIIACNPITGVAVHRMSVPCCGGLVRMVEAAIEKSGKILPLTVEITEVQ